MLILGLKCTYIKSADLQSSSPYGTGLAVYVFFAFFVFFFDVCTHMHAGGMVAEGVMVALTCFRSDA